MNSFVDPSMLTPYLINAPYYYHTFSSMGYVQVGEKWVKKDSVKGLEDSPEP